MAIIYLHKTNECLNFQYHVLIETHSLIKIMCDCFEDIKKKLDLDDHHHSQNDKIKETREPAYALIHCSANDWKNIKIPISCDADKSSSSSKFSSSDLSKNWQCHCTISASTGSTESTTDKFNVITTRSSKRGDIIKVEDKKQLDIECTLAIIKPEAMKYKNAIKRRIIEEGFQICQERILQLSPEQASELYSSEYGKLNFPSLAVYMSSGPIIVYVLAKNHAVNDWRRVMGPKDVNEAKWCFPSCIRAIFGQNGGIENVVHGSATRKDAINEINFFFPNSIVEPFLEDKGLEDYLKKTINPVLIEGLIELCKEKPRDPLLWLADWLMKNNPDKPKILTPAVIKS